MKTRDYIRVLMAPLGMLTLFACSPNQFQQTQEYDDVYFTSSDRAEKPQIIETEQIESANEKAFSLGEYSTETVDPTIVSKYNNGVDNEVVYFQETKVQKASELNYDDFVYDYENENLAYYELPLDWNTDWDRNSFNRLMVEDFQFQLAWYEQYYHGDDFRMNSYLSGRYGNRRNSIGTPRVGLDIAFASVGISPFFSSGMTYVSLNPYGFYDPFWSPLYSPYSRWGYSSFYSPYYVSAYSSPWGWNRWGNSYNNYYYSRNVYIQTGDYPLARQGRTISRGARVPSSSVPSVRSDALNGNSPNTRSERYANSNPTRSSRISNATFTSVRGSRSGSTAISGNTRSSRARTSSYEFSNSNTSRRSSVVRSTSTRSSSAGVSSGRASSTRNSGSIFSRSSSARTSPTYSRSSSSSSSSRGSVGRASSSRSSSSRGGVSSGRSTGSSSSRSSGSVGSSRSSSSSSSSRSSGTTGNTRSSSSSSSRGGRGNN